MRLKRLLIYYAMVAFLAAVLISGAIVSNRYSKSLSNTLDQFETLKINQFKMKGAVREMEATSSQVHSIIPSDYTLEQMEGALLKAVDSIKSKMKGANILVGSFAKAGNELHLPLTITGNLLDYMRFVNELSYLQSMTSPFMFIDSVSMEKSSAEKHEIIVYSIKGTLKIQSQAIGNLK
jgi:hypothetical protein